MNKLAIISMLFGIARVSSFAMMTHRSDLRLESSSRVLLVKPSGDFPPEEESDEYTGSVDWDAEWKKVVADEGKLSGAERPGKDFYKSEAEIAAIKAANKAAEKVGNVGSSVSNAMPDMGSLSGDWKFWIAILAILSIGLSVLTAPTNMVPTNIPPGGSDGSFYI